MIKYISNKTYEEGKDVFVYGPVITNLTETVVFELPMFKLGQNIIFNYKQ